MSTELIIYVLTGLAAVVVVLTRVRLGRERAAGRHDMGRGLVNLHTGAGVLALILWVAFLVMPEEDPPVDPDLLGIAALAFWWLVVVAGLLILVRWLPSRGKHSSGGHEDSWSDGPGLSILAHVGMLVGVAVFTWAYLTAAV